MNIMQERRNFFFYIPLRATEWERRSFNFVNEQELTQSKNDWE